MKAVIFAFRQVMNYTRYPTRGCGAEQQPYKQLVTGGTTGTAFAVGLGTSRRPADVMEIGSRALVRGLRGRPELNGMECVLLEYLDSTGRWGVQSVADSSLHLSLKPDNLDPIHTAAMPITAATMPVAVRLWINASLLPHSENCATMDALKSVGVCHVGRDNPAAANAIEPFVLSADDLSAYESVGAVEPASVAMLRLVCWLLVAPSTSLARLSTIGGGQAAGGSFDRGAIGRALIASVDFSMLRTSDGGSAAGPSAVVEEEARRHTLLRWRAAFARSFGVRLDGDSAHAAWSRMQVQAQLTLAEEMLRSEPETAGVARRASSALLNEGRGSNGVHLESGWLRGVDLDRVCDAVHKALVRVSPSAVTTQDLVRTPVADESDDARPIEPGGNVSSHVPLPSAIIEVARLVERLRLELCAFTGRLLLESVQMLAVHVGVTQPTQLTRLVRDSPEGDAEMGAQDHADRATRPSMALLLFLGGTCRLSLAERTVGEASAGTLVLVDCHAASQVSLGPAHTPVVCIACTFFEGSVHRFHSSGAVNLASLVLLDEEDDEERGATNHHDQDVGVDHDEPVVADELQGAVDDVVDEQDDPARVSAWRLLGLID